MNANGAPEGPSGLLGGPTSALLVPAQVCLWLAYVCSKPILAMWVVVYKGDRVTRGNAAQQVGYAWAVPGCYARC